LRGHGMLQTVKSALALAVAAVPEGLPTVATTVLAIGVTQMRHRRVLVRRLDAIETLAAVDVIAFDKTGTLTQNRMTAAAMACSGRRWDLPDGMRPSEGSAALAERDAVRLLEIAALCSDARLTERGEENRIAGTPTETALLRLALDFGVDVHALRARRPLRD